jgi:hypothetical protein
MKRRKQGGMRRKLISESREIVKKIPVDVGLSLFYGISQLNI